MATATRTPCSHLPSKREARMSDITNKAIIARLRNYPTDLNVQAADIIEQLMAERDKLQRELRRIGVEKLND